MKTTITRLCLLAIAFSLTFMLNSCTQEDTTDMNELNLTSTIDQAATKSNGPSANGQGTLTLGEISRHFSFHAKEKKNGTIQGSGVLTYTAGELKIHFDINCLSVVGNTATMSGIITNYPQFPDRVGWECWFKAVDNGEGGNADPDQLTLLLTSPDIEDCSFEYGLAINPIEGGNIQVKP